MLEAVPTCPACGSELRNSTRLQRQDDYAVMNDVWTMVECGNCCSLYLDPRPDAESLPLAYANYYTHAPEPDDMPTTGAKGLVWRWVHGYLNGRFGMKRAPASPVGRSVLTLLEPLRLKLDYYGRHLTKSRFPEPGRLLDIGCGNGAFLQRAIEMGWQVQGVEPDPVAVGVCHGIGLSVIQGDAFSDELKEGSFDVITMSHVLEHVADPSALLERAYRLLKPGGWLWIAVPNPRSIGRRLFGPAWINLHIPLHLCIPSREQLDALLNQFDFERVQHLRRGSLSRIHWRESSRVAAQQNIPLPGRAATTILGIVANAMSTMSAGWSEEAIAFAQKRQQV